MVLACAYFDETGRIMVTQEGGFPCQKITNRYIEKTFGEDELSRSHPTFLWIFRASRNWLSISDLIPGMIRNLETDPHARSYRPGSSSPTSDASSEVSVNFSTVFKQLFCVAASQLSQSIHEPFESLGVLFEEALETGTTHLLKTQRSKQRPNPHNEKADIEADTFVFGRGKYLFLNRQLTKTAADRYAAMGFRFASVGQVADLVARNMEVKPEKMLNRLERMKASISSDRLPPAGVHLACFMVRPSVHKSFDVLVPMMLQNQLPTVPLKLFLLTEWHRQAIRKFDEWSLRDILNALVREAGDTPGESDFAFTLHDAILQLVEKVGELEDMLDAVFSARPVELSCQRDADDSGNGISERFTMLTIRIMNDIHAKARPGMSYVPLSFFGAQQVVEHGSIRDRERWERRVRMEFGYGGDRKQSVGSELQSPLTPGSWGMWAGEGPHRASMSVKSLRLWPSWLRNPRHGSDASHGRAESEDETRIVKTVEISLKEEKEDGDSTTGSSSSPEVSRVTSHGAAIENSLISAAGRDRDRELDDFEKQEMGGGRGRYTAGVQGGVPFAGRGVVRVAVPGGVEMVELEAAEKGDGGWVSEVFGMFRL